jgi:hypothetical protein
MLNRKRADISKNSSDPQNGPSTKCTKFDEGQGRRDVRHRQLYGYQWPKTRATVEITGLGRKADVGQHPGVWEKNHMLLW